MARRRIRLATITALVMGVLFAWSAYRRADEPGAALVYPVACLYWILGVGIHSRSRVCAALLLAIEAGVRVAGLVMGIGSVGGLIGAAIFGFIFLQGFRGTLEDHRLRAEMDAAPPG